MTDPTKNFKLDERLSAFLDGEASVKETHELLDHIERYPHIHAVLDQHHRLRAQLRGEFHASLDDGFVGRVLAEIDAPDEYKSSNILAFRQAKGKMPKLMRATLGMAMAASLAAVTVLSVQALLPSSDGAFPVITADLSGLERRIDSRHAASMSAEDLAELNHYLISHNNSSIDHGLNSTMGFMRVAADDGSDFFEAGR